MPAVFLSFFVNVFVVVFFRYFHTIDPPTPPIICPDLVDPGAGRGCASHFGGRTAAALELLRLRGGWDPARNPRLRVRGERIDFFYVDPLYTVFPNPVHFHLIYSSDVQAVVLILPQAPPRPLPPPPSLTHTHAHTLHTLPVSKAPELR